MTLSSLRARPVILGAAGVSAAVLAGAVLTGGPSAADHGPGRAAAAAPARLHGNVGPSFDISVAPGHVAAGTYRLVVHDRSSMHNWHITGPGVNKKTAVSFTGTRRFTVDLRAGRYTVRCDMHPTTMRTHLRVH